MCGTVVSAPAESAKLTHRKVAELGKSSGSFLTHIYYYSAVYVTCSYSLEKSGKSSQKRPHIIFASLLRPGRSRGPAGICLYKRDRISAEDGIPFLNAASPRCQDLVPRERRHKAQEFTNGSVWTLCVVHIGGFVVDILVACVQTGCMMTPGSLGRH